MRLFVAAGHNLYVTWVVKHVPKLQYLCQRIVQKAVKNVRNVSQLPLPVKLNDNVQALFSPTIKVSVWRFFYVISFQASSKGLSQT